MIQQINQILMDMSFLENPPENNMRLKEDLGLDSLRLVELMVTLEDHFHLQFAESDLDPDALGTVQDLYKLLEKYERSAVYLV